MKNEVDSCSMQEYPFTLLKIQYKTSSSLCMNNTSSLGFKTGVLPIARKIGRPLTLNMRH